VRSQNMNDTLSRLRSPSWLASWMAEKFEEKPKLPHPKYSCALHRRPRVAVREQGWIGSSRGTAIRRAQSEIPSAEQCK
jgi:hypothetical protein